jgi:hypothetical protein
MTFNAEYAIMFGLAGFAAASYHLKNGDKAKHVPLYAVLVCMAYSAVTYDFLYAFLTAIEFAIGLGIAHAVIDKATGEKTVAKSEEP